MIPAMPHTQNHPIKPKRALLSVSDKTGLIDFARALAAAGVALVSTGGTAKALADAGLEVTEVAALTGFPEMMDGRVKTLHPKVHGGLLARRDNLEHVHAMTTHEIEPIDLLVINLYPFAATVARGAAAETIIENIDIGGPAMIRSGAKNHDFVTVVTDPKDYAEVGAALTEGLSFDLREKLAAAAYAHTAGYDAAIAAWFAKKRGMLFPERISFAGVKQYDMSYGENPHQKAAFYTDGSKRPGVARAEQLNGKQLSYNNLNDSDAAIELVAEFESPAIAIIKHVNPCGVAEGKDLAEAYARALACDTTSAFGGIIAANRALDGATASEIVKLFAEVVIAPGFDEDALKFLKAKKNLRVLALGELPGRDGGLMVKTLAGGLLVQERDTGRMTERDLQIVTKRAPTAAEIKDLLFAFRVAKHVKSNAIVYARDGATVGIGAGQMSRVDSTRIAAWKAREAGEAKGSKLLTEGSVVASDAFFPFADGLIAAAEAGATAIIQPGGSIRDEEVIAAADARGLAMVFTGMRHFRH
jgi:phosphoribosylaminoimidazolecarboxamide formyltransferase/IMP cyclohydrolase